MITTIKALAAGNTIKAVGNCFGSLPPSAPIIRELTARPTQPNVITKPI